MTTSYFYGDIIIDDFDDSDTIPCPEFCDFDIDEYVETEVITD